jgi:glycosyltransferase involved in cell wall biosynthesis
MNVVFVTQLIDPADPVLGFVVRQLELLAKHVDRLVVVANEVRAVPDSLDAEVVSLGKESGRGQAERGLRYEAAVAGLARRLKPAALVAHMCPVYLSLATPAVRAFNARSLLWYVHPNDTGGLRLAERLADLVITALPSSYPRPGPKVLAIGHAIDTESFALAPPARNNTVLSLVALGRTSPVKGYPVMVRAVAAARAAGIDVDLKIVGPSQTALERGHRQELVALIEALRIGHAVHLEDGVAPARVPAVIGQADAVVNATRNGSADKVVFEAMAARRPVLMTSPAFDPLVQDAPAQLRFPEGDATELAARIVALAGTSAEGFAEIGALLSKQVARGHSLDHWAQRVAELCTDLHHSKTRSAAAS